MVKRGWRKIRLRRTTRLATSAPATVLAGLDFHQFDLSPKSDKSPKGDTFHRLPFASNP